MHILYFQLGTTAAREKTTTQIYRFFYAASPAVARRKQELTLFFTHITLLRYLAPASYNTRAESLSLQRCRVNSIFSFTDSRLSLLGIRGSKDFHFLTNSLAAF